LLPAIEVALERYGEVTRLEGEVAELADRLEARKLVERAKGVLMDQGLGEAEAYRLMQRAAMDRSLKIDDVAKLIIEGRLGEEEGTS
jgi:response regulator NasT